MSYTVKPETYLRCNIQTGLSALAQARPDWREALDAVAVLFNVEIETPAPAAVIRLDAIPRRRVALKGRGGC